MTIPTQADVDAVYAAARQGDAWALPRPDAVYDYTDCDEFTLAALAVLDEARRRIAVRGGGYPTAKTYCRLIDSLALDVITEAQEGEPE